MDAGGASASEPMPICQSIKRGAWGVGSTVPPTGPPGKLKLFNNKF